MLHFYYINKNYRSKKYHLLNKNLNFAIFGKTDINNENRRVSIIFRILGNVNCFDVTYEYIALYRFHMKMKLIFFYNISIKTITIKFKCNVNCCNCKDTSIYNIVSERRKQL